MNIFNVYPKPDVCIVSDEKYYLPTKAVLKSDDISADAANLYSELWSRFSFDVSELSFASNDEKYAIIVGKPERKVTEGYDYSVHILSPSIFMQTESISFFASSVCPASEKGQKFVGSFPPTSLRYVFLAIPPCPFLVK